MDRHTFIATMTGHLAWPVTALVIAGIILFQLPRFAKFVKGIKYKDLELSIRESFTEARVVAEGLKVERKPAELSNIQAEKIARLVDIDPSIAIIEIWRRLEQEIIKLIQHNGLMRYTSPTKFMEHLVKLGKLGEGDLLLFRKLHDIRNSSVHAHEGAEVSRAEVYEFSGLVDLLIAKLDAIKQEPGYIGIPDAPGPG